MRLNLGCGGQAKPGWVNVDLAAQDGVDVVHDLDVGPWPFEDESASAIEAWDVFEHVGDPILFMTECHRILQPHKYLHLHTPHYMSPDAFTDPTHRRFPTEHTFDYWIPGRLLHSRHNAAYGGVSFALVDMHMDQGSLDVTLRKVGHASAGGTGSRPVGALQGRPDLGVHEGGVGGDAGHLAAGLASSGPSGDRRAPDDVVRGREGLHSLLH